MDVREVGLRKEFVKPTCAIAKQRDTYRLLGEDGALRDLLHHEGVAFLSACSILSPQTVPCTERRTTHAEEEPLEVVGHFGGLAGLRSLSARNSVLVAERNCKVASRDKQGEAASGCNATQHVAGSNLKGDRELCCPRPAGSVQCGEENICGMYASEHDVEMALEAAQRGKTPQTLRPQPTASTQEFSSSRANCPLARYSRMSCASYSIRSQRVFHFSLILFHRIVTSR